MSLSRRAFLLTATAAGALVVGLRIADQRSSGGSAAVEIRDWITVSPDNTVTVRVAQMEMGQGATTTMAQLLAEELGVDWSTLKTEPISIRTHLLRGKVYGRTRTDASRGVRESQELLRKCGAQIRSMFCVREVSAWAYPFSELAAANSTITHTPTGRQLTYGELAAAAATLAA